MKMDLKTLRNGTSNQQTFAEDLKNEDELKICLDIFHRLNVPYVDSFRGAINGGALYITDEPTDDWNDGDKEAIRHTFDDGRILVFDLRLY